MEGADGLPGLFQYGQHAAGGLGVLAWHADVGPRWGGRAGPAVAVAVGVVLQVGGQVFVGFGDAPESARVTRPALARCAGMSEPADYGTFRWASAAQIASSSAMVSAGRVRAAPAMFSRRWAADEAPGISMMFGECCSSQDWATAVVIAPSRLATDSSTSDCSGEKPPSGKYGTYAMCCPG